jgi:hypothetical protein
MAVNGVSQLEDQLAAVPRKYSDISQTLAVGVLKHPLVLHLAELHGRLSKISPQHSNLLYVFSKLLSSLNVCKSFKEKSGASWRLSLMRCQSAWVSYGISNHAIVTAFYKTQPNLLKMLSSVTLVQLWT